MTTSDPNQNDKTSKHRIILFAVFIVFIVASISAMVLIDIYYSPESQSGYQTPRDSVND